MIAVVILLSTLLAVSWAALFILFRKYVNTRDAGNGWLDRARKLEDALRTRSAELETAKRSETSWRLLAEDAQRTCDTLCVQLKDYEEALDIANAAQDGLAQLARKANSDVRSAIETIRAIGSEMRAAEAVLVEAWQEMKETRESLVEMCPEAEGVVREHPLPIGARSVLGSRIARAVQDASFMRSVGLIFDGDEWMQVGGQEGQKE
jgi:hypothetical protein